MVRNRFWIAATILALCLSVVVVQNSPAYVEAPQSLGSIVAQSTHIMACVVEKVDKEKNLIIFRKTEDVKGKHPTDVIRHNIGRAGFHPREWQTIMEWAEVGKSCVFFHNGGAGEMCINNYWYQIYPGGEWWNMSHAEPFLLRSFAGKPEKLVPILRDIVAGRETVAPCMVDGNKDDLHMRRAKVQRLKVSLKIQDYNPKRDFAGWGGEDIRALQGFPGFSHIAALGRIDPEALAVSSCDFDGDGKPDLCLSGAGKVALLQNGGDAYSEASLPGVTGCRAADWADYNGDGKPDLLLATAAGPKLFTNLGNGTFRDDSTLMPAEPGWNLTAATWIDYDRDGKPDILLANGYHGLRLYRNNPPKDLAQKLIPPTFGEWHWIGPFAGRDFNRVHPPEQGVDLAATYTGKNDAKVKWTKATLADGVVHNIKGFVGNHDDAACYLYREIVAATHTEIPCSFGSDDSLTVWVNGEQVLAENVDRAAAPDQNAATIRLKPGKNALLMKVCNGGSDWAFYFKAGEPKMKAVGWFEDVSARVGLGENGLAGRLRGDVLAVADVNSDGRPDFLYSVGEGLLALNTPQGFVEQKNSGIQYRAGRVTPLFADVNRDGKPDLIVPQADGCRLFRNEGGAFREVSAASGDLGKPHGQVTCAAAGDFDGDGHVDLFLGVLRGGNVFLRNNGDGTFTDRSDAIGLTLKRFNSRAVALVDMNKDGKLDVVFVNEGQDSCLLLSKYNHDAATNNGVRLGSHMIRRVQGVLGIVAMLVFGASTRAEWPTARGNPQRTGCSDGKAGPTKPRVLWALTSPDHYIASPVPAGDRLYVTGFNVFNVATLSALPLASSGEPKPAWSRSAPLLKLPVVSAPAVVGGKILFGDGMHQDSAGALYALNADGRPLWQIRLPGELIHLEGAPTVAGTRVFIGGGAAGVLCVERDRATLDGKELDDAAIKSILDAKWKELQARYEAEKKKDPDLAVPPSEDQLPQPTPVKVWQVGEKKWHVDAPVAVDGELVFVSSAFLDKERVGDRAVFCLNAKDGSVRWRQPTPLNPWGGASIAGTVVVVAGSSVNMDPDALRGARGFIAAFDRESGRPLWQKDVPGGIIGSVALIDGQAIAAATDGKLRSFDLASGERRWIYDAKSPLFAAPAVADGVAYVGDLRGAVHAVSLKDGKVRWALDVGAAAKAPGMIYGGPVLHRGRLYVATCNLKGANAGKPSCVVCLGD